MSQSEPTARDHATATDVRSRCWDTQTDPCNCVARALAAERARVLDLTPEEAEVLWWDKITKGSHYARGSDLVAFLAALKARAEHV